MPTINYLYSPNQVVFVIIPCGPDNTDIKVIEGTIIRVRAEVLVTATELEYDVQVEGLSGTTPVLEVDVFATLNAAVTEYEIRLT